MDQYAQKLSERIARYKQFYASDKPGDLLLLINSLRTVSLEGFLAARLFERGPEACLGIDAVRAAITEYVEWLRNSFESHYSIDDDSVPSAIVYWGIGGITAAMTGQQPMFDGTTSWLEPNMEWADIENLQFDPDNQWIQFAVDVNKALLECCENDFVILPFLHRSPLDAANGIRGTELFVDMYETPDQVKALINWCADWSIAIETLIKTEAPRPTGCGVGVWGTWLPDHGVFVNGDPVGLISPEQAEEFDRPSIEKLFNATGGGFFHNHTIGLYQAERVSSYSGTLVQWFVNDPNQPSLAEALVDMPELRERVLAASMQCPIAGNVPYERLDELLKITKQGRFILSVRCPEDVDPAPLVEKARNSNRS